MIAEETLNQIATIIIPLDEGDCYVKEDVLKAMDIYARQKSWKAWHHRGELSPDTPISPRFIAWWEANNK